MKFNEEEEISIEGEGMSNLLSKIPTTGGKPSSNDDDDDNKGGDGADDDEKSEEELEKERLEKEEGVEKKQDEEEKDKKPAGDEGEGAEEGKETKPKSADESGVNYESLIEELVNTSGIEFEEQLEVTADKEGLKTVTEAILKRQTEIAKQEAIEELGKDIPEVKLLIEHINGGGSLSTFQRETDLSSFKELELAEDDDEKNEQVYRASLNLRGITGEEQDELVENAKDAGRLFAKANEGKSKIIDFEEKQIKEEKEKERVQKEANIKAQKDIDSEIDKHLTSGVLLGHTLTKEENANLSNALKVVDKDGKTARDKAWEKATIEEMMFIDHLLLTGFKGLGIKQKLTDKKAVIIKGKADKEKEKEKPDLTRKGSNTSTVKIKSIKDLLGNND